MGILAVALERTEVVGHKGRIVVGRLTTRAAGRGLESPSCYSALKTDVDDEQDCDCWGPQHPNS